MKWLTEIFSRNTFPEPTNREGNPMTIESGLMNALVACAEADLNRPLRPHEKDELAAVYEKHKNLGKDIRAKVIIDEFCNGRTRVVTDSVASMDQVSNKLNHLQALLNARNPR